jgi:general secretion pathway protein D
LQTTVTLKDGGSVLIGGLISSTKSEANQGIPILGQIPGIKNFFSGGTQDQLRTELMIMIIPYILVSPTEAEELNDELQRARIELLSAE